MGGIFNWQITTDQRSILYKKCIIYGRTINGRTINGSSLNGRNINGRTINGRATKMYYDLPTKCTMERIQTWSAHYPTPKRCLTFTLLIGVPLMLDYLNWEYKKRKIVNKKMHTLTTYLPVMPKINGNENKVIFLYFHSRISEHIYFLTYDTVFPEKYIGINKPKT